MNALGDFAGNAWEYVVKTATAGYDLLPSMPSSAAGLMGRIVEYYPSSEGVATTANFVSGCAAIAAGVHQLKQAVFVPPAAAPSKTARAFSLLVGTGLTLLGTVAVVSSVVKFQEMWGGVIPSAEPKPEAVSVPAAVVEPSAAANLADPIGDL